MGSISLIRKPVHAKCFGMELECYPQRPMSTKARKLWEATDRIGFWEPTFDGSLGYGGIEWISQPMPYSMLVKQINYLHKKLEGWEVDTRCGLHIHVSRHYWSNKREILFSSFLKTLTADQLTMLFGRVSVYADPCTSQYAKYRAINLLHSSTYEFRLWAAGDKEWTLEALRRTKLIVEFRGKWTYEKCLELFTNPTQIKT